MLPIVEAVDLSSFPTRLRVDSATRIVSPFLGESLYVYYMGEYAHVMTEPSLWQKLQVLIVRLPADPNSPEVQILAGILELGPFENKTCKVIPAILIFPKRRSSSA